MNLPVDPRSAAMFLLEISAKATALFSAAWGAAFALRQRSATVRHHIWLTATWAALIMPVLTPIVPVWRSTGLRTAIERVTESSPTVGGRASDSGSTVNALPDQAYPKTWPHIVLLVWFAGFWLALMRLTAGFACMARVRRRSSQLPLEDWTREAACIATILRIARPIQLLQSADAVMPVAWGILRPKILVPASACGWTPERRRIVLLHELAHIARHDPVAQIAGGLLRAIHWFNPLAWVAAASLRYESECACDDSVLNSGIEAQVYANELLALAAILDPRGIGCQAQLALARCSRIERRLRAMLDPVADRRFSSTKIKLLTSTAALCVLLPLAALGLPGRHASRKLTGTVFDSDGRPVVNATIIMVDLRANSRTMTTSGSDGRFQIWGLHPGKYEFEVMKPYFNTYAVPSVTVKRNGRLSLDARLEPGPVQSLVVINGDVNPELARSAVETIGHWRYHWDLYNGHVVGEWCDTSGYGSEVDTNLEATLPFMSFGR